jgi:hypothetical protein
MKRVFEWYKRFREGGKITEDNSRSGRPSTSAIPRTLSKSGMFCKKNRQITVRMLSEEMSMSKTVCHEILTEELDKRKLNARLIIRSPNEDQTADRSAICADLWKLQARMTYSAVPSSLKMKHGVFSTPRKQKDKVQTGEAQTHLPRRKLVPCLRKQI